MSRRLSGQAEEIVNEIKNIIPETAPQDSFIPNQVVRLTAEDGDVMYGGRILAGKVGDLVGHLGIEKVSEVVRKSSTTQLILSRAGDGHCGIFQRERQLSIRIRPCTLFRSPTIYT